ncbi:NGG1p interacting factor NIF3 [Agaribacterium sp. ZY112]|uniref:NGG1p interacting factor NIF3 n=1 Tax=Agaribacterium sp. ZY112 TaxID=3233574 RepID=UPI003524BD2B
MYKLVVFIPEQQLESVKQAMFDAGAGKLGNYAECCWQTKGLGQFRPLPGSQPHLGELHALHQVDEWRVELLCEEQKIQSVVDALKRAHPYEEPAYDVCRLERY